MKNAKIERTMLGIEDHGIFTFMLSPDGTLTYWCTQHGVQQAAALPQHRAFVLGSYDEAVTG